MKKILLCAAMAAALCSCSSKQSQICTDEGEPISINLEIRPEGCVTKATGIVGDGSDEEKINNVQVFVFNGEALDGYSSLEPYKGEKLTINCTAGVRDVYVLGNVASLSSIKNKSELLSQIFTLQCNRYSFTMMASLEKVTLDATYSQLVPLVRLASRITVASVVNQLESPLKDMDVTLKKIYITNVPTVNAFPGQTLKEEDQVWVNQLGYQESNNLGEFTNDTGDYKLSPINANQHDFYSFPNSYARIAYAEGASFSPRRSMLVLQVQIGETLYDYPITLPVLERNCSYDIKKVIITRPGNIDDGKVGGADEEDPVTGSQASFSAKVQIWNYVTVTGDNDTAGSGTITI